MSAPTKAVILIGGPSLGTRFRPLSLNVPKPLFPILNKPLIYHHVKACASVPSIKEILLTGFFDPSLLQKFVDEVSSEFNIPVRYLQEEVQSGTAGGLYKFTDQIKEGLSADSSVFILHCDILCTFPLQEMLQFHQQHEKLCTILTKKMPPSTTQNYGCIVVDPNSHKVLHYAEKPKTFVNDLVNCGIYVFKLEVFDRIATAAQTVTREPDIYDIFSDSNSSSKTHVIRIQLETDILRGLAHDQLMYAFQTEEFWLQIKRPINALTANEVLMFNEKTNVLIHPTAQIHPSAKLGGNVTIGENVRIGAGVRVKNSIILSDVEIKDRACVINSIIGWKTVVSQWCRIEGTLKNKKSISILGEGVRTTPEILVRNSIVLPFKELSGNHTDKILL